jgi:hypothetical protein
MTENYKQMRDKHQQDNGQAEIFIGFFRNERDFHQCDPA